MACVMRTNSSRERTPGIATTILVPWRRNHWPQAYALVAAGIPIVGWVTYQNGALLGLLALAGGVSILRWPARRLARWVGRHLGRRVMPGE